MGAVMPTSATTLVWLVDADTLGAAALASYAGWLGASERARCARFVRDERRRQFIVGRAMLRLAVGRLLGVAPGSVSLAERPGQAPLLEADGIAGFSISHSGRWIACAASSATALGLDIERIDPSRDVLALARQALSAPEAERLAACRAELRQDYFYRMWCAHEARIKLGGPGAVDYPLAISGLAGMLSCAAPLPEAPRLALVQLEKIGKGGASP